MNESQAALPHGGQFKTENVGQRPEVSTAEKVLELVVVRCAGALYGIEVAWVRETRLFTPPTPIYGLPEFWAGIAALHGQLFALLDLQQLLNFDAADAAKRRQVVFTIVDEISVGLLVEEMVDVRQVDARLVTAVSPPGRPFLLGTTPDQITVLDIPGLFADPRLAVPTGRIEDAEA